MAKQKPEVNKSEEIRKQLKANSKISAKEVVAVLGEKGIEVLSSQVYFIMGKMSGRRSRRRRKAQKVIAQVATATVSSNVDAVKTIMTVKGWAAEVGGLKKLKALVDALGE